MVMYFDSLLPDSLDAPFSTPDSSGATYGATYTDCYMCFNAGRWGLTLGECNEGFLGNIVISRLR